MVSHDHYDHLDIDTIIGLARSQWAPFVVPLGVGSHLREWGIPDERIIELDWNERTQIDELTLICTPARHFSGRFLNRNGTLWASWAIIGPAHRAFFGGDTGYTKSFAEIGSEHGPFDVTLMPVGAYNKSWPDIHMNPEEAVQAHLRRQRRAAGADPLVHVPAGAAPVGRADRASADRRRGRECLGSGAQTGRACRPHGHNGIRAVVAARRIFLTTQQLRRKRTKHGISRQGQRSAGAERRHRQLRHRQGGRVRRLQDRRQVQGRRRQGSGRREELP